MTVRSHLSARAGGGACATDQSWAESGAGLRPDAVRAWAGLRGCLLGCRRYWALQARQAGPGREDGGRSRKRNRRAAVDFWDLGSKRKQA
jgi:hypothetical protein